MKNTSTKKSRTEKVEKAIKTNPYYDLTQIREAAEDADKYHALKTVFDQEGGQVLVDTLIAEVTHCVDLLDNYADMNRDQIVSIVAAMVAAKNLARSLTRAEENLTYADELLDEALRT